MKILIRYSIIISLLIGFIIIVHSCKKEELPTLSTASITNITSTSAASGGNITSDGGAEVTNRGICWNTNENPTISDSKTTDGGGTGQFVSNLTDLNAGAEYHVRAYATNSVGTAYGADMTFTTLGGKPECITQPATNISSTGVTLNGTVKANDLSTTVTFEYGLTASYGETVTATQSPVTGSSITNCTVEITALSAGTTYHFRIKAINSLGTAYGDDITFTASGQLPVAITQPSTNLLSNSVTLNGTVNANNLSTTVSFEYGTSINYGQKISATQNPVTGTSLTIVSANLSGLNPGTTYHYRVVSVNSIGYAYGDDMTFTTIPVIPTLTTISASNITTNSATIGGNILSDGGAVITMRGVCWAITPNPTINNDKTVDGAGIGNFISNLNGLLAGTTYYVRAYATNNVGTAYGNEISFPTNPVTRPSLTTNSVSSITLTTAISGGNITSDGGRDIIAKGVCWSTTPNPTINNNLTMDGSGTGSFTSYITGMNQGTVYYLRAFAANSVGTAYGEEFIFSTLLTDIEHNIHGTVIIGDQLWMAKNLKISTFNDGTPIPFVTDAPNWLNLTSPAFCMYEYNIDNADIYGGLYNWYAVGTGKLCPVGWHVPTLEDYIHLRDDILGGFEIAGGKIKATGTLEESNGLWHYPNTGATNESGFTGVPAGSVSRYGTFGGLGYQTNWWLSTELDINNGLRYGTNNDNAYLGHAYTSKVGGGFSVRCIKD